MNSKIKFQEHRNLKIVAHNVRQLLRDHQMHQTDLSNNIGVGQPTISRLISEVSMPRVSAVKAIADYYGLTIDYLLTNHDNCLDEPTGFLTKVTNLLTWKRKKDNEKG